MELREGKMTTKELAKWFEMSYGSFRNTKEARLKELATYCTFKEVYGGVEISDIICAEHVNLKEEMRAKDVELYLHMVKFQHELTSISAMIEYLKTLPEYKGFKDTQLRYRLSRAGVTGFGVTADATSSGIHGSREFMWAVRQEKNYTYPYRLMTEEEQNRFND